ncbi:MAG: dTMP kinase [Candidatus Hydrogenedentes bacterium]|nr:dTMP kinase [Candidatus Hydrogenedentota bacterium]
MKGIFITVEGVEGCGKSTQILLLKAYLESRGREVIVTREPGGTAIAETIRSILLDPENAALSPMAEAFLYAAARAQHVDERIRPALEAGKVVLSDRFADSTTAYQGAGRQLPEETIQSLHSMATRGTWPHLTIVVDVPAEEGLKRAGHVNPPDRIEMEPIEFHRGVREAFLQIAQNDPARVHVVDGTRSVEAVAAAVRDLVEPLLGDL